MKKLFVLAMVAALGISANAAVTVSVDSTLTVDQNGSVVYSINLGDQTPDVVENGVDLIGIPFVPDTTTDPHWADSKLQFSLDYCYGTEDGASQKGLRLEGQDGGFFGVGDSVWDTGLSATGWNDLFFAGLDDTKEYSVQILASSEGAAIYSIDDRSADLTTPSGSYILDYTVSDMTAFQLKIGGAHNVYGVVVQEVVPSAVILTADQITWLGEPVAVQSMAVGLEAESYDWDANSLPSGYTADFAPNDGESNPTLTISGPQMSNLTDKVSVDVTVAITAGDTTYKSNTITVDVYNNACQAARIGLGEAMLYGDLSGDCQVNLDDLAIMASSWMIGNFELTAPQDKP